MTESVIVAAISLFGTLFGSLAGIIASGKLTSYRLTSLEKKVDEFGKSMLDIPLIKSEQQNMSLRIESLEQQLSKNRFLPA